MREACGNAGDSYDRVRDYRIADVPNRLYQVEESRNATYPRSEQRGARWQSAAAIRDAGAKHPLGSRAAREEFFGGECWFIYAYGEVFGASPACAVAFGAAAACGLSCLCRAQAPKQSLLRSSEPCNKRQITAKQQRQSDRVRRRRGSLAPAHFVHAESAVPIQ